MVQKFAQRDHEAEIKKAFKAYDDDENGYIEAHNLENIAQLFNLEYTEEELEEMIRIGDQKKLDPDKPRVDMEDFMALMEKGGLYKK